MKTARISDGIVRLYYVAGENALTLLNEVSSLIHTLTSEWGISQDALLDTAVRFFEGYKKYSSQVSKQSSHILDLSIKVQILDPALKHVIMKSQESTPTLYISNMPQWATQFKEHGKSVIFVRNGFVYGLLGETGIIDIAHLEEDIRQLHQKELMIHQKIQQGKRERGAIGSIQEKEERKEEKKEEDNSSSSEELKSPSSSSVKEMTIRCVDNLMVNKGKDKKTGKKVSMKVEGIQQFVIFSLPIKMDTAIEYFKGKGFQLLEEENNSSI